jgi:hypothetical protein
MALFIVQVFKQAFDQRPWSNVYFINAGDLSAATVLAGDLVTAERDLHYDVVTFLRYRVSNTIPGDDVFSVTSVGLPGTISSSGADFLPLFNTLRVDFNVDGGGRPSRKFYRTPIAENEQTAGIIDASPLVTWQGRVTDFLDALGAAGIDWVDPDGQQIISGSVQRNVQMRQLHRRRRRSVTP